MTLIAITLLALCCLILGAELTVVILGLLFTLHYGYDFPILFLLLAIGVIAGLLFHKK